MQRTGPGLFLCRCLFQSPVVSQRHHHAQLSCDHLHSHPLNVLLLCSNDWPCTVPCMRLGSQCPWLMVGLTVASAAWPRGSTFATTSTLQALNPSTCLWGRANLCLNAYVREASSQTEGAVWGSIHRNFFCNSFRLTVDTHSCPLLVTISGKNDDYFVCGCCAKTVFHQQKTFLQLGDASGPCCIMQRNAVSYLSRCIVP